MDILKSTAGGEPLIDALLRVHDSAPLAEKRSWLLLAKAAEDAAAHQAKIGAVNLEPLAGALLDAARSRLEGMVKSVLNSGPAMTRDAAERAVAATDVGSMLEDIVDMAGRIAEAAPSLTKLDASLAKKAAERDLIDRAKAIQIEKARDGAPVSLVAAIEIAKAEEPTAANT